MAVHDESVAIDAGNARVVGSRPGSLRAALAWLSGSVALVALIGAGWLGRGDQGAYDWTWPVLASVVVLCSLLAGALLADRIAAPLREMADVARAVASGDWQRRATPRGPRECAEMARDLNALIDALSRATEENQALALYMQRLSRHAMAIRDVERKALAAELHDRIGQNLTAAQLTLRAIRSELALDAGAASVSIGHLGEVEGLLQSASERTRNVLTRLRPPLLDEFGIVPALQAHVRQMKDRGARLDVAISQEGGEARTERTMEGVVFDVLVEALHNVEKHAMCDQAHVMVRTTATRLEFIVRDEGRGFDPATPASGWGLPSMRERIRNLGGEFELISDSGVGTEIRIAIPQRAPDPGAASGGM